MKKGIFVILTLFILQIVSQMVSPMNVSAAVIDAEMNVLLPGVKRTSISEHLYILEDREKRWAVDDVRSEPLASLFQKNKGGIPNFGYTSSAYWAYFVVNNQTEATERLFEIGYPALNDLEIYIYDGSELKEKLLLGSKYPFYEREFIHPHFLHIFDIETNETLTFYIRFESQASLQMPLYIYEQSGFIQMRQDEFLFLGMTYGILGVMAIYNLFIFFSLRHMSYFFYVLVIGATFFSNLSFTGVAYQYLWPNSPVWNELSVSFFLVVGMIFAVCFAYSFLEIKKYLPSFQMAYRIALTISVLLLVLVLFSVSVALNLVVIIIVALFILILLSAFLCWGRGLRQARFFVLAWSVFLCGVLLTVLADAAIIPLNSFTKLSGQVAATIEVILLSLALADRINILQYDKNNAVEQLYLSQKLANDNLRRTDELKDQFLAMTSHELRTPLNGIIGIAETLQEGAAGHISREMHANLSLIILSGRRLFHLINDILDFSKLKNKELQLTLTPINMKEITDVVIMVCKPLINNKKINLHNHIEESITLVHADENRIQQILFNLIGNAIKYTEEGDITISAEDDAEDPAKIKVFVSDTGIGIPPAELPYIFDQFHQSHFKNQHVIGGAGLGLSITKQLVELHEGEIFVESELNKGSTFSFTLLKSKGETPIDKEVVGQIIPASLPKERPLLVSTAKKNGSAAGTSTILIADDEVVNLQVLVHQLTLEGHHVIYAVNGEEVLQLVQENDIDLVILDIMMPNMSGYEVCRRLREQYSLTDLPILMLTAKNQVQDMVTAFEVGANDYLTKPCDRKELLSRVETLIQLRQMNLKLLQINQSLEEKVAERTHELAEANQSLTVANEKLVELTDARRRLLINISHELGTPITLIQNYVQAVQEGIIDAGNTRYLTLVSERVKVLERLTQDLFDLSKLEAGQLRLNLKEMNLEQWIRDVVRQCEQDAIQGERRFISPLTDHLEDQWREFGCRIDVERMTQVFSNLVWNAVRHTTPEEGEIGLEVCVEANEVVVMIKDNGCGIAQDEIPYLFERFYRVESESVITGSMISGSGLGLAIVKEMVQHHQGRVWVESKVREGSSFYVALPIWKGRTS